MTILFELLDEHHRTLVFSSDLQNIFDYLGGHLDLYVYKIEEEPDCDDEEETLTYKMYAKSR